MDSTEMSQKSDQSERAMGKYCCCRHMLRNDILQQNYSKGYSSAAGVMMIAVPRASMSFLCCVWMIPPSVSRVTTQTIFKVFFFFKQKVGFVLWHCCITLKKKAIVLETTFGSSKGNCKGSIVLLLLHSQAKSWLTFVFLYGG